MMKHVTCYTPKWGKYGIFGDEFSNKSQQHQVTYQIARLVTLFQKNTHIINLFYLLVPLHDETWHLLHPKMG